MIAQELRIFGVHGMAVRHYPGMLSAIAGGSVRPGELVAKTIGLDEVGDELASMGRFAQEGVTVASRERARRLAARPRASPRRQPHHSAAASASTSVVAFTLSRSTHSSGACRLAPIGP